MRELFKKERKYLSLKCSQSQDVDQDAPICERLAMKYLTHASCNAPYTSTRNDQLKDTVDHRLTRRQLEVKIGYYG